MKEMMKRLLSGILCLLLVFGVASPAYAAAVDPEDLQNLSEEEITMYYSYAQIVVDTMVSKLNQEPFDRFQGSKTPALVRKVLVPAVALVLDEYDQLDDLMLVGMEPTKANKELLADEVYEVACVYYDESHRDGGTEESANRLAVIEIVRFVLVTVVGVPNDQAIVLATENYEVYIKNISSVRIYGDTRYETGIKVAEEMKQILGVDQFSTIVVACGTGFADALSGSYLAAKKNAPILLVNKHQKIYAPVVTYIQENLTEDGIVYILGGEAAVTAEFEAALDGCNVVRLAGANRYETSLLILEEAGVSADQEVLVCTGKGFADSLSASASGLPVLLVKGTGSLTAAQQAFADSLGGNGKFVVIGGESAVAKSVENALAAYGTASCVGGSNRYDTSKLIAQRFFPEAKQAVLAYASNYPDGLCGGPLAYILKAPLILTKTGKEASAAEYTTGCGITKGYVLGGTNLIADESVRMIFNMRSIQQILVR